jgi:hypothetical protein
MSSTSLAADGNRWWWTPAAAGAAVASVIAAVFVVPAIGTDAPPAPVPASTVVVPPTDAERPCFMWRASRGGGWDGFQPTCPQGRWTSAPQAPEPRPGATRRGLDYAP